MPAKTKGV